MCSVLCCVFWAAASSPEAHLRARAAELGPQAAAVGWRNWDQDGKKPASSAFSIGPVFHPASRSRARHGENQSTNSLPPPRCLPRISNLPTIASSVRLVGIDPRVSVAARTTPTSRPRLRHLAQPILLLLPHPNRLLLLLGSDQDRHQQQHIVVLLSRPCPASIASEPLSPSANPQS